MRLEELKAEIGKLDLFGLRDVRDFSRHLLKNLEDAAAAGGVRFARVEEFKIGDVVEFTSKAGNAVRARIVRFNFKSLSCVALDTGGKWRVSRSLVRLVESTKEVPVSEVLAPASPLPVVPSMGAKSTAAGAGSW